MAADEEPAGEADAGGGAHDTGRDVVAHLQTAALEVIAAGRALLDAAEEVVRDPTAAVNAVSTLAARARPRRHGATDAEGRDDSEGSGGVQRIPVT